MKAHFAEAATAFLIVCLFAALMFGAGIFDAYHGVPR